MKDLKCTLIYISKDGKYFKDAWYNGYNLNSIRFIAYNHENCFLKYYNTIERIRRTTGMNLGNVESFKLRKEFYDAL